MTKVVISESQWLEICGLLTLGREYHKKINDIESTIIEKFNFIDGYFSDELWENISLIEIRNKWLNNPLIDFTIKVKGNK